MKKLLILFILFSFALIFADELWLNNLEEALQKAKTEHKSVLVNFTGSDWCIWCKRLKEEVFATKEFIAYAKKNLVLVEIDFPSNKVLSEKQKTYNDNLAKRFAIQGFPTIVIFDENKNILKRTGYLRGGAENYINHLEEIIKGK